MKRSKSIKLTLLMGATGGLTACGDRDESALIFQDVDECTSFGVEQEACQYQYQQALQNHQQEAPKYAAERLCESDFDYDRCEESGGIWRPIMAGFMVAALAEAVDEGLDMMKKRKRKKAAFLSGGYYSGAKPLYRARDDFFSYRNSQNDFVASSRTAGTTTVKSSKLNYKPRAKSVTRSRGGFGRSASRSSWGS